MTRINTQAEVMSDLFPRTLRAKERDLLEFVLPSESPGYAEYRNLIAGLHILAEGRRGRGNFILGKPGDIADVTSPLAAVIAYGVVETTLDNFTITVREHTVNQIDVEIISTKGEEIPDHYEEKRRWTYSSWRPGSLSPATQTPIREVRIGEAFTLAVAGVERRLWLFDASTKKNHLIPITNFYNELMLHRRIRDPKIALNPHLFFEHLAEYSDRDLCAAFIAYNKVRRKVHIIEEEHQDKANGWPSFFKLFRKKN